VFDERVYQLGPDKAVGPEDGRLPGWHCCSIADFNRVINTAKQENVATDGWVPSLFYL